MREKSLLNISAIIVIILFFIGVAFAPSINANVSISALKGDLVEIISEFRTFGKQYDLKLAKEEQKEVEQVIDYEIDHLLLFLRCVCLLIIFVLWCVFLKVFAEWVGWDWDNPFPIINN